MGQNGGEDDGDTRRKRTPSLSSHESIVQRSAEKAKAGTPMNDYTATISDRVAVSRRQSLLH